MKTSQACPKCSVRKFWIVKPFSLARDQTSHPMAVQSAEQDKGMFSSILHRPGTWEIWICRGCGFSEWYAHCTEGEMKVLTRVPGSGVQEFDASIGPEAPFR